MSYSVAYKVLQGLKRNLKKYLITNRNNLYEESVSQVVVWLDPPRAVDWGNLTKILLTILEEKYKDSKIDKKIDDFPEEIIDRIE